MDAIDFVIDPALTPDWQAVENEEEQLDTSPPPTVAGCPPDALAVILRLILPAHMSPLGSHYWQTASVRLAAMAWSICPEVRCYSQTQLADALGVTRASLCVEVTKLRDKYGLGWQGGRPMSNRETFAEATRQAWARRKRCNSKPRKLDMEPVAIESV